MSNRQALMRMFLVDKFTWLLLPWLIMLLSFAVNLIVAYFVEGEIVTGGIASIFIFMFIMGMVANFQYFSFIAGLGVRRTDFLTGMLLMIAAIGVITGLLLVGLSYVEHTLIEGWGLELYFFSVIFSDGAPLVVNLLSFILWLLQCFCLGLVFGCAYRRFGKTSVYIMIFGGVIVSALSVYAMHRLGLVEVTMTWLEQGAAGFSVEAGSGGRRLVSWLAERSAFDYALLTLPLTLVYMALSYLFLRKAVV